MSSDLDEDRPNFCSRCGNRLGPQAKFCSKCGASIRTSPTPSSNDPISAQNQPIPPVSQQNPISNQNTGIHPYQSPNTNLYSQRGMGQTYSTPETIQPTSGPVFNSSEQYIILMFTLVGVISHLLRYLLIYNKFPDLLDLLLPIPFYFLGIFFLFQLYKRNLQNKGINGSLDVDKYDHMVSLVLSSFFLTNISHRIKPDLKSSTIPEKVHIPQSSKMGFTYQELEREDYLEVHIQPRSYMYFTIVSLIISAIVLYFYIEPFNTAISPTLRLLAAYFGGLVVVNVAPAVGKHNKEFSEMGRFRTLLVFFFSFAITLIAIFGERFLAALSNQV